MSEPSDSKGRVIAVALACIIVFLGLGVWVSGDDSTPTSQSGVTSPTQTTPNRSRGVESIPPAEAERLTKALTGGYFPSYRKLWTGKIPPVPSAGTTVQFLDGTYHADGEYARVDVKTVLIDGTTETRRFYLINHPTGWKIEKTGPVK